MWQAEFFSLDDNSVFDHVVIEFDVIIDLTIFALQPTLYRCRWTRLLQCSQLRRFFKFSDFYSNFVDVACFVFCKFWQVLSPGSRQSKSFLSFPQNKKYQVREGKKRGRGVRELYNANKARQYILWPLSEMRHVHKRKIVFRTFFQHLNCVLFFASLVLWPFHVIAIF